MYRNWAVLMGLFESKLYLKSSGGGGGGGGDYIGFITGNYEIGLICI